VIDERRYNAKGSLVMLTEATIKAMVGGRQHMTVAEGNGPVHALDRALRDVLLPVYPELKDMRLADYKVRILTPAEATNAVTRVMIESTDSTGNRWWTVGVSHNIIEASYDALRDSIDFKLLKSGAVAPQVDAKADAKLARLAGE
jgi:2-isopropylmalate synthase